LPVPRRRDDARQAQSEERQGAVVAPAAGRRRRRLPGDLQAEPVAEPVDDLRWPLAAALVILGVAGTVLPALPGAPLVFAGLLVAASIDGFQKVGWFTLGVLGVLTLVS